MRSLRSLTGAVPVGWTLSTLGAVAGQGGGGIQTGPFGSQLHASDYVAEGIPSIMPQNIGDNRLVQDGIALIDERDAQRLSRYRVQAGDIVYSRRGDVEKRALIREPEDGWLCGTGCLRVRLGSAGPDPAFVSYYLGDPRVRRWVVDHAVGATMPNLNTAILSELPLLLPSRREQRAIAGVLGALDDKIELNRRMNETLLALAETTYAKHRQSSHQVRRLGDVLELAYGHALKESNRQPGAVLVYGSNGVVGCHDEALSPGPGIIVGRKGNPGVVTWVDEPFYAIDTTFYVVPRLSETSLYHLYFALRRLDLPSFAADSAVPGLNRNIAYGLEIELPEPEVILRFDSVVSDLFAKRAVNKRESRTLTELRNTLLPKLISGELRVRDAEAVAQRAM